MIDPRTGKLLIKQPLETMPVDLPFEEPDWTRIPGFKNVTKAEWESAKWQRQHSVKTLKELKTVLGELLPDDLAESILKDQKERATMPMLVPPHMINTMNVHDLWNDPVRRYMIPALADRHPEWPNHPMARRDSLHEVDMWVTPGLVHRYPRKVLFEPQFTCPQYCGHCTRMDAVGEDVPQVVKLKFELALTTRLKLAAEYLTKKSPEVCDIVLSGGDPANMSIRQLEWLVFEIFENVPNIRDIRFGSKALNGIPQHFLQPKVLDSFRKILKAAKDRGVRMHFHTHINHANQVTPLIAKAVQEFRDMGFRGVRNQGVLLRGVNATVADITALCDKLIYKADITPYYFYVCDMIPNSEHWRLAIWEAQEINEAIMGWHSGFHTPRFVCDVPFVGKRYVHQTVHYDRRCGVSWWTKSYHTAEDKGDPIALERPYPYYDPIYTLPPEGQEYWKKYAAEHPAS